MDVKVDWMFDVLTGKWWFIAKLGDHCFVTPCGKANPENEPGYLHYLREKAIEEFKKKGLI